MIRVRNAVCRYMHNVIKDCLNSFQNRPKETYGPKLSPKDGRKTAIFFARNGPNSGTKMGEIWPEIWPKRSCALKVV